MISGDIGRIHGSPILEPRNDPASFRLLELRENGSHTGCNNRVSGSGILQVERQFDLRNQRDDFWREVGSSGSGQPLSVPVLVDTEIFLDRSSSRIKACRLGAEFVLRTQTIGPGLGWRRSIAFWPN